MVQNGDVGWQSRRGMFTAEHAAHADGFVLEPKRLRGFTVIGEHQTLERRFGAKSEKHTALDRGRLQVVQELSAMRRGQTVGGLDLDDHGVVDDEIRAVLSHKLAVEPYGKEHLFGDLRAHSIEHHDKRAPIHGLQESPPQHPVDPEVGREDAVRNGVPLRRR